MTEETSTVVCAWGSGWRLQYVPPGRSLTRWLTRRRSDEGGGGGGNKRVWHLNRRHFFTEQHRWAQAVSQSVNQKWWARSWSRHSSSLALCSFTVCGDWWRGGCSLQRGLSFCSRQQDASGCRTHSGGHDEDATVFCGERCVDPEWDKPHVSQVYPLSGVWTIWNKVRLWDFKLCALRLAVMFWTVLKPI